MLATLIRFQSPHANPVVQLYGTADEVEEALQKVGGVSKKTAQRILEAYPYGGGLSEASENALRALGAGPKQAERIRSAFALATMCDRACQARLSRKMLLRDDDVAHFIRTMIGRKEQEYFVVLYLDSRMRVIEALVVAIGSLAQVDVHPREVFRPAVRLGAYAIIVAHNHPSGEPDPSAADIELTRRLVEAGKTQGIPVLDHVIVTPTQKVSLSVIGLMPKP